MDIRQKVKDAKRIVIKIGSSSITHSETGELHLSKIEKLIRQIAERKLYWFHQVLLQQEDILLA